MTPSPSSIIRYWPNSWKSKCYRRWHKAAEEKIITKCLEKRRGNKCRWRKMAAMYCSWKGNHNSQELPHYTATAGSMVQAEAGKHQSTQSITHRSMPVYTCD